jgi:hypothetical protein
MHKPTINIDVEGLASRFGDDDELLQELVDMLTESWTETADMDARIGAFATMGGG